MGFRNFKKLFLNVAEKVVYYIGGMESVMLVIAFLLFLQRAQGSIHSSHSLPFYRIHYHVR